MQTTTEIGRAAENLALNYLTQHGLKLITRNYEKAGGEIDLIMMDGNTLVFIEVRYKKNARHGSPIESIHYHKQRKIIQAANHYMQWQPLQYENSRLDVVGIEQSEKITWIKNAFQVK